MSGPVASAIREHILRDARYPVHRIAERLLPYLRLLVEKFHPRQVILFGSYAYAQAIAQFGGSFSGVELLQEAIERYLKGLLVAGGWPLERIHDLNRVVEAAMTFDERSVHCLLADGRAHSWQRLKVTV